MILTKIAQKISEDTKSIIGYPISISDQAGHLIGVNDTSRLGLFDPLLHEVIVQKEMIYWGEEAVKDLVNIFPGVAAPIIVNGTVLGAIGILGKVKRDQETENYIQLVKNHIEMRCHEAIRKEFQSLNQQTIDTFLHYLLFFERENLTIQHVETVSTILNIEMDRPRFCILLELDQKISSVNEASILIEMIRTILQLNEQDVIGQIGPNTICILKTIPHVSLTSTTLQQLEHTLLRLKQRWMEVRKEDLHIAVGDGQLSIIDVVHSYREAENLIKASRSHRTSATFFHYKQGETIFNHLVQHTPEQAYTKLIQRLAPLFQHKNYIELKDTFIAYCHANFNSSEAARDLFIHRNTLTYRLKQIEEQIDLPLDSFQNCIALYTLILLHDK